MSSRFDGRKVLFMHPNFPGQFRHLAPELDRLGADVRALTLCPPPETWPFLVECLSLHRAHPAELDPWLVSLDSKLIRGRSALPTLRQWRREGWVPDLVIGHTGWGDMLGIREVFPTTKVLGWFEFYYHATGLDLDFDPEFPPSEEDRLKTRLKNMWPLWMLEQVDQGVCPTYFQREVHPAVYHSRLSVVHEGIDTQRFMPKEDVQVTLGERLSLTRQDEVITFVNRDLEPYRGYHVFLRALPEVLALHPRAHVLIVGGDSVSYGAAAPAGTTWKHHFLKEVGHRLDPERVHFLGKVPHATLTALMQLSRAHVYLTYPFVLSWSLLEAMSCGAPVIGSDTAPVREVIRDGENGWLVDFFDTQALVARISSALHSPEAMQPLRDQARQTVVERYDLRRCCLPQQVGLVNALIG